MWSKLKYVILALGLGGVIGIVALPFVEVSELKIYALDTGIHGIILLIAFLVPALLAGLGIFMGMHRWQSILAAVGFLVAGMKSAGEGGSTGQTVALFAAFLGLIVSILAIIKPEPPRQA